MILISHLCFIKNLSWNRWECLLNKTWGCLHNIRLIIFCFRDKNSTSLIKLLDYLFLFRILLELCHIYYLITWMFQNSSWFDICRSDSPFFLFICLKELITISKRYWKILYFLISQNWITEADNFSYRLFWPRWILVLNNQINVTN